MQLGTRWTSGQPAPSSLPPQVRDAVAAVDHEITAEPRPRWTLTWLEGRPVCDLDTGVMIEMDAAGTVTIREDDADSL